MNSMCKKGQQLILDQEMSLVESLGGPDFSATWICMRCLWVCICVTGAIHPLCLLHFDSYSKATCAGLRHPHNYIRRPGWFG